MPGATEWIKYGENDYDKLDVRDKLLFDDEYDPPDEWWASHNFSNDENIFDARK